MVGIEFGYLILFVLVSAVLAIAAMIAVYGSYTMSDYDSTQREIDSFLDK